MMWRGIGILSLCAGLAGCGTAVDEESGLGLTLSQLRGEGAVMHPRFIALLKAEAPALQVAFVDQERTGTVLLEDATGDFHYWLSADGAQLILQSGMLHGTRGLGEGLLASDISEPLALIRGLRAGVSDRFHTYLDGNDRAVTRTYRCVIVDEGAQKIGLGTTQVAVRLMRETCQSLDQNFINLYWVSPTQREIILSRQWAGPFIGAITMRIVPQ